MAVRTTKTLSKKLFTLLDLCVSSLRRGHANLLCIVPILTDDPRRESRMTVDSLARHQTAKRIPTQCSCIASEWQLGLPPTQLQLGIFQLGGVTPSCHPSGGWSVKCMCSHHVLLAALMARPNQVGTPQG